MTTASETHRAIEAVWRIESARLIAGLTRVVRDVGVAEELAQDALVVALENLHAQIFGGGFTACLSSKETTLPFS